MKRNIRLRIATRLIEDSVNILEDDRDIERAVRKLNIALSKMEKYEREQHFNNNKEENKWVIDQSLEEQIIDGDKNPPQFWIDSMKSWKCVWVGGPEDTTLYYGDPEMSCPAFFHFESREARERFVKRHNLGAKIDLTMSEFEFDY